MFPGRDVNFDGVNTLNQFVTFGIATAAAAGSVGPIDWATLAQQWIQMRDHNVPQATHAITNNNIRMPEAPPPPNISGSITEQQYQLQHKPEQDVQIQAPIFEEKGEADMDMDDEDEHNRNLQISGITPTGYIKAATNAQTAWMNQKLIPTAPQWSWSARGPMGTLPQDRIALMAATEIPPPPPSMTTPHQSALIPSLLKIDLPTPSNPNHHQHHHHHKTVPVDPVIDGNTMDAAKRKILPAWLREGIEKMEREKLKLQMEQQPNVETDVNDNDDEPINNLTSGDIVKVDDNESINKTVKRNNAQTVTSDDDGHECSFNDEPSAGTTKSQINKDDDDNDEETVESEKSNKTYEEKVSDLMMIVRRTLTELLLDVTNTEIAKIAQETLKAQQAKASSAQVINKSALSSITGKLGLAVYDDSSSDGDSDNEDDAVKNSSQKEDIDVDSEEELKKSIRMKRRNFARIAEKLEEEIAVDTLKDEERLKYEAKLEAYKKKEEEQYTKNKQYDGMGKSYEKDFGETTSDSSLLYSNGKHKVRERSMRRERTTRFSDNNEPKTVALAAAANYLNQLQQNINKTIKKSNNTQSSDYDDVHAANSSSNSTGLNNMLCAAEAALKKATKAAASFSSSSTSLNAKKAHESIGKEKKNKRRGRSRTRSNSRKSSRSISSTSRSSTSKSASYSSTSGKHRKEKKTSRKLTSKGHRRRSSSVSSDDSKSRRRNRDDSKYRSYYKSSSYSHNNNSKRSSYERNRSRSRSRSSRSHSTRSSVSHRKY